MPTSPLTLIRQAVLAPVVIGLTTLLAVFAPEHDMMTQHMSELQASGHWAGLADRIGTTIAGASVVLFSLGCLRLPRRTVFPWTAAVSFLFGAAMMSNGIVLQGSPLHGLYGLALFIVLVPALFVAEHPDAIRDRGFREFSLFASTMSLVYMWALLIGVDPDSHRGLTQTLATFLAFGWYGIAAWRMGPHSFMR